MGKYIGILKNVFQTNVIYRFNSFAFAVSQLIVFGVFFYIWSSIYRQGGQMGGYSLAQLVFYYLGTIFVSILIKGIDVAQVVGDDIRLGVLNNYLLTPIDYFWRRFMNLFGGLLFRAISAISLFVFGLIFLAVKFNFSFNLINIFYFLGLLVLAYLLNFLIFYIVGISTFWFGFIWAFNFTAQTLVRFLDGSIIPLDLLPTWFGAINNWLPFKYIIFVPVAVLAGRLEPDIFTFLIPALWIIPFFILAKTTFKRGLKKYEGFGA